MNEREYIIEKAKELGVTAEELGVEPREVIVKDTQLIHEVSEMIHSMETEEDARDYINEKYWDDLGIRPPKKYKVMNVRLSKTIYKDIKVVIPEDEEYVEDYIDYLYNLDNDYPDDEEDWEIGDYDSIREDLTEDEIKSNYSEDEIWNYNDIDTM